MRLNFAYPSVLAFPQSSILLQKGGSQDSTPTETALGVFLIVAAQPLKAPGAHLRGGHKSSKEFMRGSKVCALSVAVGVWQRFSGCRFYLRGVGVRSLESK